MFPNLIIPLLTLLSVTSASPYNPFRPPSHILPASSDLTSRSQHQQRATVCNGHAELCTKNYGNVTFIGTHNSYAVGTGVAFNQDKGILAQLNDGVRMLQMQVHTTSTGLHLCHSSCALVDGGTLVDYLKNVTTWLAANPNEVVTLLMTNPTAQLPTTFAADFTTSGASKYVYTPASAVTTLYNWPTLGSMIDQGGRLVVFMDYQADFNSVPYIIDEFSNMWEDAFDVTSQDFGCAVNRTSGSPTTTLYTTNHFLDIYTSVVGINAFIPNKSLLNVTNSASGYGSIGQGVANCAASWGRYPNFILLDFYDSMGIVPFQLAAQYNSVSAPTNVITPGTVSAASTKASSTNGVTVQSLSAGRLEVGMGAGAIVGCLGAVLVGVGAGVGWTF